MTRGIMVFGSSGSGTTTLGRAAANRLGFAHFDVDDYLWRWDTALPFSVVRPREERIESMMRDLSRAGRFSQPAGARGLGENPALSGHLHGWFQRGFGKCGEDCPGL